MLLAILLLGEKHDGSRFDQEELDFFSALASDVAMAIRNAQLFEDLKREAERNRNLFIQTTIALGSAIEAKDAYTHGHTERVTKYSLAIGRQMEAAKAHSFPNKFFENLYISGLRNDIGEYAISESYFLSGPSDNHNPDEIRYYKDPYCPWCWDLSATDRPWRSYQWGEYHHERYDGKGYPDGLKGKTFPPIATIIAVADTFDAAMITDRPYRKGLSKEKAILEMLDRT